MFSIALFIFVVLGFSLNIHDVYIKFRKRKSSKSNKKFHTFKFVQTKRGVICYEEMYGINKSEPIIKIFSERETA